jgi:hypothetical protein
MLGFCGFITETKKKRWVLFYLFFGSRMIKGRQRKKEKKSRKYLKFKWIAKGE